MHNTFISSYCAVDSTDNTEGELVVFVIFTRSDSLNKLKKQTAKSWFDKFCVFPQPVILIPLRFCCPETINNAPSVCSETIPHTPHPAAALTHHSSEHKDHESTSKNNNKTSPPTSSPLHFLYSRLCRIGSNASKLLLGDPEVIPGRIRSGAPSSKFWASYYQSDVSGSGPTVDTQRAS